MSKIPSIQREAARPYLSVQGNPFLAIGAEVDFRNAIAPERLEPLYGHAAAMGCTTLFVPVLWSQVETEKGRFTFGFWRDRKGLLGNPLSLFGNLIWLYSLATWMHSSLSGHAWGLQQQVTVGPAARLLLVSALASQAHRLLVRMGCTTRLYGLPFALGTPFRVVWANWMNAVATSLAILRYTRTRLARQPHVWLKTDHVYPVLVSSSRTAVPAMQSVDSYLVSRRAAGA